MAGDHRNDSLRGVIRDLTTQEGIYFYFIPEEITEDVEVSWEEATILGRSAPIVGYSGTGARTVSFLLHFHAHEDAYKEVFQPVMFLQSLKYPEYSGSFMRPPHKIRCIMGLWFLDITGILQGAQVTWKAPYDVTGSSMYPMAAEVSLSIKEVVETPVDYRAVRDAHTLGEW